MTLYMALFRGHELSSEDNTLIVGLYLNRSDALEILRKAATHDDDEWSIREHFVNQLGPGEIIWDSHAEKKPETYACFYKRFWPAGYPNQLPTCSPTDK